MVIYVKRADGKVVGIFKNPSDNLEPIEDDHPDVLTFHQKKQARRDLSIKKALALNAIKEKQLADAMKDPNAPQAVKDYARLING